MLEQGELSPFDLSETWSPERVPLEGPNDDSQDDQSEREDADYIREYEEMLNEFTAFPRKSKYWPHIGGCA